jgi:Flp pilus assembly protein TadG
MSLLARFGKDRSGNVAMLFGLALVPVLGLAGAALDYARASTARATLDAAVDSAALMVAREASRLSDSELRRRAEALIRANIAGNADAAFGSFSVSVDRPARRVSVSAQAEVQTSVTRILGVETMPVSSVAQAGWGTNRIELALVLDNTGSMGELGKMVELKKATKALIRDMQKASTEAGQIRVSIVPFATQVRMDEGNRNADWLRFDAASPKKKDWKGCIMDRDEPYDTGDAAASGGPETRHPAVACKSSEGGLATIRPLTDSWKDLNDTVDAMTAGGNTNVAIGVAWGMAALSNSAPLTEAQPNAAGLTRYMIVLTDGDNTQNRYTTNQARIDAKTRDACTAAKATGAQVYTVRVVAGNANLLRNCATKADMFYDVKDAAGIGPVIEEIARQISQVRLTS